MDVTIYYNGKPISVSKEIADYLESDRKRQAAERRWDRRHLSKSDFEQALDRYCVRGRFDVEEAAIKNLMLESLREAIKHCSPDERCLLDLRFDHDWTLEQIGREFGISKVAVHKRLKSLLGKLRASLEKPSAFLFSFLLFIFPVNKYSFRDL